MNNQYVEKAQRAANRAAAKVLADALLHKRPLPIWKEGKVEYMLPTEKKIQELKRRGEKE